MEACPRLRASSANSESEAGCATRPPRRHTHRSRPPSTKGGGSRTPSHYSKGSGLSKRRAMRGFGSDQERRRRRANALYVFEMMLREEGISDFVYDEEKDLFRFPDGRFAFSREWADIDLLQERGYA